MSGNPTTQPTNVVPMPTNWPGPMFPSGGRPWPQSPSCFSELASLNACYDSVQMMNQILAKVMTDLVTNDPAVQKAIVEAIAASGSNVPLIGVTNGADAQPGQVGEYYQFATTVTLVANGNQTVTMGILQPGDWDVYSWGQTSAAVEDVSWNLQPTPAGFSNAMNAGFWGAPVATGIVAVSAMARALISAPTLMAFIIGSITGGGTVPMFFEVQARRRR